MGLELLYTFVWSGFFFFLFEDFFYYNRNSVIFKYSCKEWLLLKIRLFTLRLLSLVYSDYSSPHLEGRDIPEPGIL